ncbi:hypothetical protein JT359_12565 [Candidatus Poribacteria bacterium]|nr:hypothetical protein [Candidatus Poribacteria bacterium]
MKKVIFVMAMLLGYSLTLLITPTPSFALPLGEVAIFTEQSGWIAQNTAQQEGEELADLLKKPSKVVTLTDKEIGDWAKERTDNGLADIIVTFGWFPTNLYTPGNADPDDSVAELFLEGGNVFLNTADYIFYVTQGGGANGEQGLKNMMDINADMWSGGSGIKPTADGKKYTPSLGNFTSERTFKAAQIVDPWEVEAIFGDTGSGNIDPAIVHDTETGGRIGIAFQEPNNAGLPRGEVLAEMIDNFLFEVLGAQAVDPQQKATTTWGHLKSGF